MRKIIAVIFWILKIDKKQSTPYFSTILLTALLIAMHLFLILLIFKVPGNVFRPIKLQNYKMTSWVNTVVFFTPIILLLFCFFPKRKLVAYEFSESEIRSGRKKLIIYSIVLMILLLIFGIKKGIDEGVINL